VIGGNVDLDLLSLFLKKMQESWEGWGGKASSSRSAMEEREKRKNQHPNEEEGALYSPRMKSDRYRNFNPEIPASGAEFLARERNFRPRPLIKFPPPYRGLHHSSRKRT
jgi:hypothetical protein